MVIKVLGPGCMKCQTLEKKVIEVVQKNNIDALVQKVTDLQQILNYGVMITPALVINEKVVSTGVIPKEEEILNWIREAK